VKARKSKNKFFSFFYLRSLLEASPSSDIDISSVSSLPLELDADPTGTYLFFEKKKKKKKKKHSKKRRSYGAASATFLDNKACASASAFGRKTTA
jgi:hypothetical protein